MLRVDASALERWAAQLLATGLDRDDAAVVAGCLVEATLRGVDSHGVLRLPQYVEALRRGEVNPLPQIRFVHGRGATAIIDADGGDGYRPTFEAVSWAVALARQVGIRLVGVRSSHRVGMAASSTIRAAQAGVIGFVTTTATPSLVPRRERPPRRGKQPRLVGRATQAAGSSPRAGHGAQRGGTGQDSPGDGGGTPHSRRVGLRCPRPSHPRPPRGAAVPDAGARGGTTKATVSPSSGMSWRAS